MTVDLILLRRCRARLKIWTTRISCWRLLLELLRRLLLSIPWQLAWMILLTGGTLWRKVISPVSKTSKIFHRSILSWAWCGIRTSPPSRLRSGIRSISTTSLKIPRLLGIIHIGISWESHLRLTWQRVRPNPSLLTGLQSRSKCPLRSGAGDINGRGSMRRSRSRSTVASTLRTIYLLRAVLSVHNPLTFLCAKATGRRVCSS